MKRVSFVSVLVVVIILIISCTAGCVQSSGIPGIKYAPELGVQLINSDSHFSLSKGVYYEATYQVYNRGNADAKNVYLTVQLVRSSSNVVDDTKRQYIGTITPGGSRTVTVILDGYSIYSYSMRSSVDYDR